jgi:hypothetical protein
MLFETAIEACSVGLCCLLLALDGIIEPGYIVENREELCLGVAEDAEMNVRFDTCTVRAHGCVYHTQNPVWGLEIRSRCCLVSCDREKLRVGLVCA